MRKVNLITTLSLTVVMLAMMTGIAIASPEDMEVSPGTQDLQPGQNSPGGVFSTYTINVGDILPPAAPIPQNEHTIKAVTTGVSGGGNSDDLRFKFHNGALNSGWIMSGDTWNWKDGGLTVATLSLDVMDTGTVVNAVYQFKVYDEYPTAHWGVDEARATVYGSAIPEFTTIAIPVASILGLLFYFNHRKRRKE